MRTGQRVGGRFKIGRLLGSGGAGEVYAAEGPNGERAAIKFLREEVADDDEAVARFQREADIAARIRSPYVASVLRAGRARDKSLWIAFELLEGESLDVRLRRAGRLGMSEIGPIIDDVLQGLWAAHVVRVIHRDIKPANIFLQALNGATRAKILDFGVGKMRSTATEESVHALTAFEDTIGSVSFMPPEQVGGAARVDERADLYAVGVVAFLALAGKLPFIGTRTAAVLQHKLNQNALSLKEATQAEWPEAVEAFFKKILARTAADRFATASEALDAWRRLPTIGAYPALPRSIPLQSATASSTNDTDVSPPSQSERDDSTTRD